MQTYYIWTLLLLLLQLTAVRSVEIDGGWKGWSDWSMCSVTCGGGEQTRKRACADPVATPGGQDCQGDAMEKRPCADWHCPDCESGPRCPREGRLDATCTLCWCDPGTIIRGKARENHFYPRTYLSGVEVLVEVQGRGRDLYHLAVTDCSGAFEVKGLCQEETFLFFSKPGYVSKEESYRVAFTSDSSGITDLGEIIMYEERKPVISLTPNSELVEEGFGIQLRCESTGRPEPTSFKWYKDGKLVEYGDQTDSKDRDGKLSSAFLIRNALIDQSGDYQCVATSDAGSSWSQPAALLVYKGDEDEGTCEKKRVPSSGVSLHESCTVVMNGQDVSSVNEETCGQHRCPFTPKTMAGPTPTLGPTGPMIGSCGTDDVAVYNVSCDGDIVYPLGQVDTCGCHPNLPKQGVLVEGIVRMARHTRDGHLRWERVPKLHFNIIGAKSSHSTSSSETGEFVISLNPTGKTLTFQIYTHFNRLNVFPHTSVLHLVEGVDTYRTIINLRERPAPVKVLVDELISGHTFALPKAGGKISPGTVTLKESGLHDRWGEPLPGETQIDVFVDFLNTRQMGDFASVPGEMEFEAEYGTPRLLKTYGVFWLQMEHGKELVHTDCPMEIQFKPTEIKLPHPEKSCKLKPLLWTPLKNEGQWKPWAKLEKVAVCDRLAYGKKARDLYSTGAMRYKPLTSSSQLRYSVWRPGRMAEATTNILWDRPVFNIAEVIPRAELCVIAVRVFRGSDSARPLSGEQVVVYSRSLKNDRLVSFQSRYTGKDGEVCLIVPCETRHTLTVWSLYEAVPSQTHHLPTCFKFQNSKDGQSIEFVSSSADEIPSTEPLGPVHRYVHQTCTKSTPDGNGYYFSFSVQNALAPDFLSAVKLGPGHLMSWYHKETRYQTDDTESCFIRVALQTKDIPDTQIVASSYYGEESGAFFGTYTAGVRQFHDPQTGTPQIGDGFACLQVKCSASLTDDMGKVHEKVPIRVNVKVLPPAGQRCKLRWIADYLVSNTSEREDGGRMLPLNIRTFTDSSLEVILNPVSFSDSYDYDYRMPGFYRDRGSDHTSASPSLVKGNCISDGHASVALFDCADEHFQTDWWDKRIPPGEIWELNVPPRSRET